MLGLEDARMLADMLSKNTPLRTLNLSQNELDSDCAALIANALVYNNSLNVLDLKSNRMGDFGVQHLLTPLIRKELQMREISSKKVPVFNNLNMKLVKNPATKKRSSKQIIILTSLQLVDIGSNMVTEEVFKQILTLLKLND